MLGKVINYLLILIIVMLQSCAQPTLPRNYYYVPEEQNLLSISDKHQFKIAGSTSDFTTNNRNINSSHFNAQVAYSPLKHVGIFGSYLTWRNRLEYSTVPDYYEETKYKLGSVAIGGYFLIKKIDNSQNNYSARLLTDIYFGFGTGSVDNTFSPISNSLLKFNKPYAQIGLHWIEEKMDISIVHRFGRVNFFEGNFNGNDENGLLYFSYLQNNQIQKFQDTSIKISYRYMKIEGYMSWTLTRLGSDDYLQNLRTFPSETKILHTDNITNIGIVLNIHEIYQSIKKRKK